MIHDIHGNPRPDLQRAIEAQPIPLGHWIVAQLADIRTAIALFGAALLSLGLANFLFLIWAVFS